MEGVFEYELPRERIASWPVSKEGRRSDSKLLVAQAGRELQDLVFRDIVELLQSEDVLITNNSQVMPRRVFAKNERNEVEVELLLLLEREPAVWECLAKPMRRVAPGDILRVSDNLWCVSEGRNEDESKLLVRIESSGDPSFELDQAGVMPIPPYIRNGRGEVLDRELYQTVYAECPGSVAAPTAGLHFTPELLAEIRAKGVQLASVTLHVGAPSFKPLEANDDNIPRMGKERFLRPTTAVTAIERARARGGRAVCVGTTTVRALESYASGAFEVCGEGDSELLSTELAIFPEFGFQLTDILITNFHLPGSTHLALVSAFFGEERVRRAYEHALQGDYRFLSYGDAMLLVR